MAFFESHFFSDVLGLSCSAHVLIPQETVQQIGMKGGLARERYPTLYLLHGLSDDHTIWMRRTAIERYASEANIAVVMPAVGRSFYQDTAGGAKYWTYLSEELPVLLQRFFPLSDAREDTFAAGLSMGGYGALRLGLGCPEKFAAVASLSGALDIVRRCREAGKPDSRVTRAEFEGIFGRELAVQYTPADLHFLAERLAQGSASRPKLFVGCGTEDELLPDSREFRDLLTQLSIEHTYKERPGAHEWGYWDREIQRVLDWLPLRSA